MKRNIVTFSEKVKIIPLQQSNDAFYYEEMDLDCINFCNMEAKKMKEKSKRYRQRRKKNEGMESSQQDFETSCDDMIKRSNMECDRWIGSLHNDLIMTAKQRHSSLNVSVPTRQSSIEVDISNNNQNSLQSSTRSSCFQESIAALPKVNYQRMNRNNHHRIPTNVPKANRRPSNLAPRMPNREASK